MGANGLAFFLVTTDMDLYGVSLCVIDAITYISTTCKILYYAFETIGLIGISFHSAFPVEYFPARILNECTSAGRFIDRNFAFYYPARSSLTILHSVYGTRRKEDCENLRAR